VRAITILIQTIVGGIGIGSLYALVALGTSMIYRSMGLINFANGSIYMVGTYLGMIWYTGMVGGLQLPYWLSFFVGVLSCAALGLLVERIVRRLAGAGFADDHHLRRRRICGKVTSALESYQYFRGTHFASEYFAHHCCSDSRHWTSNFSNEIQNRKGNASFSDGSGNCANDGCSCQHD